MTAALASLAAVVFVLLVALPAAQDWRCHHTPTLAFCDTTGERP